MKRKGSSIRATEIHRLPISAVSFRMMMPALEYIKEQRWPDGRTYCEKCKAEHKHYRVTGRTAYACDHCGNHIYPLAGTIFEKSTTT